MHLATNEHESTRIGAAGAAARHILFSEFERKADDCYNQSSSADRKTSFLTDPPQFALEINQFGQVAQLVERSPEKAGVGGSIPSLATIKATLKSAS